MPRGRQARTVEERQAEFLAAGGLPCLCQECRLFGNEEYLGFCCGLCVDAHSVARASRRIRSSPPLRVVTRFVLQLSYTPVARWTRTSSRW